MTFPSAGSFPYHCSIHPGMIATVTVQYGVFFSPQVRPFRADRGTP
jgi:hypothetical protein